MKKKNKILIWLLLIIPISIFIIGVKADSGFDNGGWDSGGSWDSSWDSGGSSWDSDSSWGSGGIYFSDGSGGSIITLLIMALIFYSIIKAMRNAKSAIVFHKK